MIVKVSLVAASQRHFVAFICRHIQRIKLCSSFAEPKFMDLQDAALDTAKTHRSK